MAETNGLLLFYRQVERDISGQALKPEVNVLNGPAPLAANQAKSKVAGAW